MSDHLAEIFPPLSPDWFMNNQTGTSADVSGLRKLEHLTVQQEHRHEQLNVRRDRNDKREKSLQKNTEMILLQTTAETTPRLSDLH